MSAIANLFTSFKTAVFGRAPKQKRIAGPEPRFEAVPAVLVVHIHDYKPDELAISQPIGLHL